LVRGEEIQKRGQGGNRKGKKKNGIVRGGGGVLEARERGISGQGKNTPGRRHRSSQGKRAKICTNGEGKERAHITTKEKLG